MKLLLANGKKITEVGSSSALDNEMPNKKYTMHMSGGANQSIWNLSGKPHDQKKLDMVNRLMASCAGQTPPHGEKEFVLHRMMLLAWHMEWIFGMIAGSDTHHVLMEDPDAVLKSFSSLCEEMANIENGPMGQELDKAKARAKRSFDELMNQRKMAESINNNSNFFGNNLASPSPSPFNYGYGQPVVAPDVNSSAWSGSGFGEGKK